MNQRIQEEHMYWRAGRNWYSDLFFKTKEILFGKRFNNFGWDYYIGGIFERPFRRIYTPSSTAIITNFDWRHRHDANKPGSPYYDKDNTYHSGWLTINKFQDPCNTCYIFGPIGAVEGVANVFYNIHDPDPNSTNPKPHLDLNLSELQTYKCYTDYYHQTPPPPYYQDPQPPGCDPGGNPFNSLMHLKLFGTYDDETGSCYSYNINNITDLTKTCANVCPDWQYNLKITGFHEINVLPSNPNAEFDLKEKLILTGPLSSSEVGPVMGHSMALVGYEIAAEGMKVYQGTGPDDPDIVLDAQCPFLGSTTWWFKDSRATYPFYRQIVTSQLFGFIGTTHYIDGVILTYKNQEPPDVQWADEDGDGYYWWGIGPKPDECPGDPDEEDCNDNDPNVSFYNKVTTNGIPLYDCIPFCNHLAEPFLIGDSDSITGDRHFNRDLIIQPGGILTIKNCTVSFSAGSRLIVQRGGKLNLIGNALLTSKCDTLWRGVEVWGSSTVPHSNTSYHGTVYINNGTIDHAEKAITTVKFEYDEESGGAVPVPTCSGGIVKAENAVFRNNLIGVEFYPYQYENNSYFRECHFETDNQYRDVDAPDYFIKMTEVTGVDISSCHFSNSRNVTSGQFAGWGGGIYSYNSSVNVTKYNHWTDSCRFINLTRGIYILNSGDTNSITIEKASFTNTFRAIYCSGLGTINCPRIVQNNFSIFNTSQPIEQYPYGIYLDHCSGYKIEANTYHSANRNNISIGLIINNSGPQDNLIYRNTFKNLYAGIIAQNRNRHEYGTTGLELKCNIFSGLLPNSSNQCKYDISVTANEGSGSEYGIRQSQGTNQQDYKAPAGNVFSNDVISGSQWQYLNSGNFVNYYYHPLTDSGEIVLPTRFSEVDPPVFDTTVNVSGGMYIYEYSCPSTLNNDLEDPDSLREELFASEYAQDSLQSILSGLIDGGSTEMLNNSVLTSWPEDSIPLRNDLLTESPYLSDSVMISSIQKEEVLSSKMITEILSANPHAPKSKGVMDELNNRLNQLTDEQWFTVLDGLNFLGAKEALELELTIHKECHTKNLRKMINYYKTAYTEQESSDSIIALLSVHGDLISRYEMVNEYLSRCDTIQAMSVYNAVLGQFLLTQRESDEYNAFGDYLAVRISMIRDTAILIPDSLLKITLYSLINENSSLASAYARAFLIATDTLTYDEPVILPDPLLKQGTRIRNRNVSQENKPHFTLFPNPASYYVIVQFNCFTQNELQYIEFIDMNGKCVKTTEIPSGILYYAVDVSNISTGCYLAIFKQDGKQGNPVKFCVVR